RYGWGQAAGSVLHVYRPKGFQCGSGSIAQAANGEAAGEHGAGGVCTVGESAVDGERETGPESVTGAGRGCVCGARLRSADGRNREQVGGDLGGGTKAGTSRAAG